jgi:phytoene dehydrogenase-like protein
MSYDVIIIGAGHNGITAGIYLAKAGYKTLILERNEQPGGCIRSGEITRPGFVHDLYSANQNLFLNSQVFNEFKDELARYGLDYALSDKPYANIFPDEKSLRVYMNQEKTMKGLAAHNQKDAEGWQQLGDHFGAFAQHLLPLLSVPLPSVDAAGILSSAVAKLGISEVLKIGQIIFSSTRELTDSYLETEEAKALIASWGMHLDFGPNVSGGAMFPFVESFANMQNGMAFVRGGASNMINAMLMLYRSYGGEIRTATEVDEVLVKQKKIRGVRLSDGEQIKSSKVLAITNPTNLFTRLIAEAELPEGIVQKSRKFQYGPGTMMIHLAMSDKTPWAGHEDLQNFAYVHLGPYIKDMDYTYTQSLNGYLPDNPMIICGQPAVVDPTRAPGKEKTLWLQIRTLPSEIKGDAAGKIQATHWDEVKEAYADRVLDKLEAFAPGTKERILDRKVFSPLDLQRDNPNLQGGDSVAGSHHIFQNFIFRPFNGYSNYKMPIEGLYMAGASTWPGGGTNATSGYLAAKEILKSEHKNAKLIGALAAAGGSVLLGSYLFNRFKDN